MLRVHTEISWSRKHEPRYVRCGTSQQGDGPTTSCTPCRPRLLFLCAHFAPHAHSACRKTKSIAWFFFRKAWGLASQVVRPRTTPQGERGRSPHVASSTMRISSSVRPYSSNPAGRSPCPSDMPLNRIRKRRTQGTHAVVSGNALTKRGLSLGLHQAYRVSLASASDPPEQEQADTGYALRVASSTIWISSSVKPYSSYTSRSISASVASIHG